MIKSHPSSSQSMFWIHIMKFINLVKSEKVKLGRIFSNVEGITENLKASNDKVAEIIGNTKKITEDLVLADFKSVINEAKLTLTSFNKLLASANSGEGTLGKLISDEKLYNELLNKLQKRGYDISKLIKVEQKKY